MPDRSEADREARSLIAPRSRSKIAPRNAYDHGVFVETIVLPRDEWERWHEHLRLFSDPPPALVAAIAWDSGDGEVTGVNVWETPGAIADFFLERVGPLVEAEGEPTSKPRRHGEPLAFYRRPAD